MNKLFYLFLVSVLFSCGGGADQGNGTTDKNASSEANIQAENEALQKERALAEQKKRDSINLLLDKISVTFFKNTGASYDSEGWCVFDGEVSKIRKFDNSKTYKCSKGEYIQELTIDGICNKLHIQFLDEKDKVLEDIKDFNLDKSASFTAGYVYCEDGSHAERKDKNYKSSFDKASKVTIAYEDSIFYSASWKNSSKRWVQY